MHVRIHTCEFELIQFSKILICRTHPISHKRAQNFLRILSHHRASNEGPEAVTRFREKPSPHTGGFQKPAKHRRRGTPSTHQLVCTDSEDKDVWKGVVVAVALDVWKGVAVAVALILRTALLLVCGICGNECLGICGNDYLWNLLVCRICRNSADSQDAFPQSGSRV